MPALKSSMIKLGSDLPDFQLQSCGSDKRYSNDELMGKKGLTVMFVSHHCPYVKHLHKGFQSLWNKYKDSEIGFVAISSNDVENYPDDSPANMQKLWNDLGLDFPVLYDESQEVAKIFDAQCTPDFFVYDSSGNLYYRGRFDSSSPGNNQKTDGKDINHALDQLLGGNPAPEEQSPSIGCSIKWK